MKINLLIKYQSNFSCLSPQGHSTDVCSSYDGSWDTKAFNKRASSTLTAAFLSAFEFCRRKRCAMIILLSLPFLAFDHMPGMASHRAKRKTPAVCYIKNLNKAIDKPTWQDITFLALGCCLAACEDPISHISSSLQTVVPVLHTLFLWFYFLQNGQWHELQPRNYSVSIIRTV